MDEGIIRKVAIITGSAGNLGQAVAHSLDQTGARLALFDRVEGRLSKVFPQWDGSPDHLFIESVDLTEEASVLRAVTGVIDRFGRVDILINAAGGYQAGEPLQESSARQWDDLIDLNARTVFSTCRAVIPYMLKQSSGKIINIGARSGLKGTRNAAIYSASKSAVLRLTESMSAELKHHGINVNAVIPGTIDTPENREQMPEAKFEQWVSLEELSSVIRFLVSDEAAAIHGALVPVYGLG